jgi:excisionase family DNA binding protein
VYRRKMAEEKTTAVGAYLNLEEAAKFLKISPRFVQKLYLKGDLPVERLGRRVLFDPLEAEGVHGQSGAGAAGGEEVMEVAERTIVLATPLLAPRRECDRHYHGAGRYTCWHVETPEQQYEVQVVRAGDRLWARCGVQAWSAPRAG